MKGLVIESAAKLILIMVIILIIVAILFSFLFPEIMKQLSEFSIGKIGVGNQESEKISLECSCEQLDIGAFCTLGCGSRANTPCSSVSDCVVGK